MMEFLNAVWHSQNPIILLAMIVLKILAIIIPVMLGVAYLTYAERKVIAYIQGRLGPNRVGYSGLLQPFADMIKLLFKEVLVPSASNKFLFIIAPMITITTAFAAWAVIPFNDQLVLADINVGLLYVLAMTSLGIYGILIAGWASNSKYAMFGALRAAAQAVSYEIAMGFALIGVMMAADSLNLSQIVLAQSGGLLHWYWLPLLPLFVIYFISGIAETNRAPFDMAEGESEIVAGFNVEYSGANFILFFLAEYANMILISFLAATLFLGGWLSPFPNLPVLGHASIFWLFAKVCFFLFVYLWIRATFPRYRYDQIMALGWKVFIPVTLVWIAVLAAAIQCHVSPWFG